MPEEKTQEMADAPTEAPPPVQYLVHSVARGRHNRAARAALPQKPKRKQFIGGEQLRLTNGRPITVSADFLKKNIEELRQKEAAHVLEVRTLDGRRVDLRTLEPSSGPAVPANTIPAFQPDSVNNDKNFPGLPIIPPYTSDELTVPEVLKPGEKPALFDHAQEAADAADQDDRPTPINPPTAVEGETAPAAKEEVSSDKKARGGSGHRRNR